MRYPVIVWLVLCDFIINQTKIKVGCQSGRKVEPHDSKSDLPLTSLFWILYTNSCQFIKLVFLVLNGHSKNIDDDIHCFIFIFIGETSIKFSVPVTRTGHFQSSSITLQNNTRD